LNISSIFIRMQIYACKNQLKNHFVFILNTYDGSRCSSRKQIQTRLVLNTQVYRIRVHGRVEL